MDIYLVNSGKCDFFNPDPPLRNALYKNKRDGTFIDRAALIVPFPEASARLLLGLWRMRA